MKEYSYGEVIQKQGDKCREFYLIVQGVCKAVFVATILKEHKLEGQTDSKKSLKLMQKRKRNFACGLEDLS